MRRTYAVPFVCVCVLASTLAVLPARVVWTHVRRAFLFASPVRAYIVVDELSAGWSGSWLELGVHTLMAVFRRPTDVHDRRGTVTVIEIEPSRVRVTTRPSKTEVGRVVPLDGSMLVRIDGEVMSWSDDRFVPATDSQAERYADQIGHPIVLPNGWVYSDVLMASRGTASFALPLRDTAISVRMLPGVGSQIYLKRGDAEAKPIWASDHSTRLVSLQEYDATVGK